VIELGFVAERIQEAGRNEMATRRARTLSRADISSIIQSIAGCSRRPERDLVILLLGLTCGMRVSEIARLRVEDVLDRAGNLRAEVSLRAAITKGGRQRNVFLSNVQMQTAMDRYLQWRIHNEAMTLRAREYRGLDPASPLVLTPRGEPYVLAVRFHQSFW
jgi:integrase